MYLLTFSSDRTLRAYAQKQTKAKKTKPQPKEDSTKKVDSSVQLPSVAPTNNTQTPTSDAAQPSGTGNNKTKKPKEKWLVAQLVNKRDYLTTNTTKSDEKEDHNTKGKEKEKVRLASFLYI